MRLKRMIVLLFVCMFCAFSGNNNYSDGKYRGVSRSIYTNEPYYGHTTIEIINGRIVDVVFIIRDSSKHVKFDDEYEKYFAGNDLYIEQCRKDRIGVKSYPDSLLKYQNPDKIDAITGATWSYHIFKASVVKALEQAH